MACSRFRVFLVIAAVTAVALATSANAVVLFTESFEDPDVLDGGGTDPTGWTCPGHPSYLRLVDNNDTDPAAVTPYGDQALSCYNGPRDVFATTTSSILSDTVVVGTSYTLSFNVANDESSGGGSVGSYYGAILAVDGGGTETVLASVAGDNDGSNDMSFSDSVSVTPTGNAGERLAIRLGMDPGWTDWHNRAIIDNVQLDAESGGPVAPVDIPIPNGSFEELYKPGTAIPGQVAPGGWTQGVGPDCPIDSGQYEFSDSSTGTMADIAGWIGADRDGWIANGGTYGRDETTGNLQGSVARQAAAPDGVQYYLSNGGSWGNAAGGLIVSDAPLATVEANATYTLSMLANGSATPIVLDLLAGGVMVTPSSLVDPTLSGAWQEFSRTYDPASLAGFVGDDLTILLGVGRGAEGAQSHFDSVGLTMLRADIIPEPATLSLLGLGALLALRRRRSR